MDLPIPQCGAEAGPHSFCYGDNLYTTITHCPDNPGDGTFMSLAFSSGEVNANHTIWVYDGDNVNTGIAGPATDLSSWFLMQAAPVALRLHRV